jgi:hypothetical protein
VDDETALGLLFRVVFSQQHPDFLFFDGLKFSQLLCASLIDVLQLRWKKSKK